MQRRCRRRDEVNTVQKAFSTMRRPQIKSEDHAQLKPIQRNDGNGPVLGDAKYTSNQPPHALVMQRHDARERAREHRPPRTQLQRPAKEPTPHTHARAHRYIQSNSNHHPPTQRSEDQIRTNSPSPECPNAQRPVVRAAHEQALARPSVLHGLHGDNARRQAQVRRRRARSSYSRCSCPCCPRGWCYP